MTLEQELELSYYRDAAPIHDGRIWLVQDQRDGKLYVRKDLTVFNRDIYLYLKDHPVRHTPRIHHVIEDGERLVVIEDYIPGDTLEEILDREGPLPEEQVLDIWIQLCRILRDFHHASPPIVNRDIKPSNIKLTEDGIVKLLDLNAAKYVSLGSSKDTVLLGTQGYAAPEQYGFGASNVQTDIYAAGVLMNVLLTGRLPGEKKAEGRLGAVIARCTPLDPGQRFESMDELLAALSALERSTRGASGRDLGWRRYLPPGFRSGSLLASVPAIVGYAFLLFLTLGMEVADASPLLLALDRICALGALLSCVLFTGNYLDVQDKVILTRTGKPILKILGVAVMDAILFMSWVILATLLSSALL